MKYDPTGHKRRSIRLKGYNYAQKGLYFVTICTQHRTHFYGEIINNEMMLNPAGKMISNWYYELENKFNDIKCGAMIIMPNHFHCIIQNVGTNEQSSILDEQSSILDEQSSILDEQSSTCRGEHIGSPLHVVIQWFKTMTTNEYIRNVKSNDWKRFNGKLWQRNYWEHIIRNEKSYHKISQYIASNPQNWKKDTLS
jgi:REP element-mobilizing transposase RayT